MLPINPKTSKAIIWLSAILGINRGFFKSQNAQVSVALLTENATSVLTVRPNPTRNTCLQEHIVLSAGGILIHAIICFWKQAREAGRAGFYHSSVYRARGASSSGEIAKATGILIKSGSKSQLV